MDGCVALGPLQRTRGKATLPIKAPCGSATSALLDLGERRKSLSCRTHDENAVLQPHVQLKCLDFYTTIKKS